MKAIAVILAALGLCATSAFGEPAIVAPRRTFRTTDNWNWSPLL